MPARRLLVCLALGLTLASGVPARPAHDTALLDSLAAWHHRSRPDRVDSLATPAIAAARREASAPLLGQLLLARGRTRAAFGRGQAAQPDLTEALELATAAGDTTAMLRSLRWLSVAVGLQGKGAQAGAHYDDLERLAAAAGDSIHLGWAWTGQAYALYLQGDAEAAARRYRRAARTLAGAGVSRGAMWARNGEALARRQLGDFAGARRSFRQVLDLARATDDQRNQAVALDQLGRLALQLGDPGEAEGMLEQAAAIHRRYQHHREGLLSSIDLATVRQLMGQTDVAAALLAEVRARCRDLGLADLEVVAVNRLADLYLDHEQPARAAAMCREVLRDDMPSAMADVEVRLRLSRSLAARDSLAAALRVLPTTAGAATLELRLAAQRGRLLIASGRPEAAVELLAGAVTRHQDAGLLLVPALAVLGRAHLASGRPDVALAPLLRGADLWQAGRDAPADPRWRERRGARGAEVFSLAISATLAADPRDGAPRALALAQRYKAGTLRERLGLPRAEAWPPAAPPVRPGEVLLDVVQGPDRCHVFGLTPDTTLAVELRDPNRRQRLRRLRMALTSPAVDDPAAVQTLAAGLLDSLPAGLMTALSNAHTVIWCPDGAWHDLPLALLAGRRGWLEPTAAVTRAPSAAVWASLRGRRAGGPASGLVAMHGAMPGATAECRMLQSGFRHARRVAHRPEAGPTLVPPGTAVLHLAAHVDTLAGWPWQAGLALGGHGPGRLSAADVAGLDLDLPLVVLAGCRTTGTRLPGEGLLGLASGFLASGAGAVVATLWDVDDRATVSFTRHFYDGLASGQTVAAALNRARKLCRDDPDLAAPRHWAGFVLLGDGGVTVPLERRTAGWPVGLVLLGLAGVLGVVSRRR